MSLKPKRVNFTATWSLLQETLKGVITLGDVPRSIWNDSFRFVVFSIYSNCSNKSISGMKFCYFLL